MKTNKKHLIVGTGQIGSALYRVLFPYYDVSVMDKNGGIEGKFDVMHVCYPPVKNFINITKSYIKKFNPTLVIIHSTVPVGSTKKISSSIAVHSPVRGVHPNLDKGIKVFVKYFAGPKGKGKEAAKIFSNIGIKTKVFEKPETTELLKILDTTYYGWNIIFAKEVKRICDKLKVNFDDVYTIPNHDYNDGYVKLGNPNVARPVLKAMPGKIGGHCVIPNLELFDDWIADIIKKRNKKY